MYRLYTVLLRHHSQIGMHPSHPTLIQQTAACCWLYPKRGKHQQLGMLTTKPVTVLSFWIKPLVRSTDLGKLQYFTNLN